jgi:hypothetical protein|tara:strand:+ start:1495 stop:1653 length:159 start_codon:yes stop_codon:yes gene_type:complete
MLIPRLPEVSTEYVVLAITIVVAIFYFVRRFYSHKVSSLGMLAKDFRRGKIS